MRQRLFLPGIVHSKGCEMRYHETSLQVRFYEVDAYGVVWHGHYVGWFEVGRNDLTQRYQMGPLQLKERNLPAPVVDLNCQFKLPATFGSSLIIQTTMERTEVAKLIFRYRVLDQGNGKVLATGSTTHVLTDLEGNLLYRVPPEVLEKIEAMRKYLEV
jgi:acyl-CoA thioester hydrolase